MGTDCVTGKFAQAGILEPTEMINPGEKAKKIRAALPPLGLFGGKQWRVSPFPFRLDAALAERIEALGRVLLQFYRAADLLYRRSAAGKEPAWIAHLLAKGKPSELVALQNVPAFRKELPRVIRPDLLLTENGLAMTELDSVPGGIGLTAWLNQTYSRPPVADERSALIGGAHGMKRGFESIFGEASRVHIVVSDESAVYRPEMEWLAGELGNEKFNVRDPQFANFAAGDAVYRFFELFDLANVHNSKIIFEMAAAGRIKLTPPPKPHLEEKSLLALLWNRGLRNFWRRELGEAFFDMLLGMVPYTWVVDPTPIPPQAVIPELNLTDWRQLKELSQRDRALILKVSGFSPRAWGARGVFLGSDMSRSDWAAVVDQAIADFPNSPWVLQRYHKPKLVEACWFDFDKNELAAMSGRVRLCPYYFVMGQGDPMKVTLGGVLATICPADKKIIHGMSEAILAPCSI